MSQSGAAAGTTGGGGGGGLETLTADIGIATEVANNINLLGGIISAGGTPVQTSASGNQLLVNAQLTSAQASSAPNNAGIGSFDSASFTVDMNGFVELLNAGGLIFDTNTGSATPLAGHININAGVVTASGVPINSTGSGNSVEIDVQLSSATAFPDTTAPGISSFDSAAFDVDINGFVTNALGLGRFPITPFVVGPLGLAGYQTIQDGLDAANLAGGGSVWVMPGNYTEDLTLYDGTQVVGAVGDSFAPLPSSVVITGVHTPPATGDFIFKSVLLISTTDIIFSAAAGGAVIIVDSCNVGLDGGYILNLPNWTGVLAITETSNAGSDNGVVFNKGGAVVFIQQCSTGAQGSASVLTTSGFVLISRSTINCPVLFDTGSSLDIDRVVFNDQVTFNDNATGTVSIGKFSASGSAVTMSSSNPIFLLDCIVNTNTSPAIAGSGSGTLTLNEITFVSDNTISGTLTIATTGGFYPAGNLSTAGYVWTSNGTGVCPTFQPVSTAVLDTLEFDADSGTANPSAGVIQVLATTVAATGIPIRTTAGSNLVQVNAQLSSAQAVSDPTAAGLASFDNTSFTVDANGFVQFIGSSVSFPWIDTSGGVTAASNTGYFITGLTSSNLPGAPNQGDVVRYVVDTSSQLEIVASGTHTIRFGNIITSPGGSILNSQQGDAIELVFRLSPGTWFASNGMVGAWTTL